MPNQKLDFLYLIIVNASQEKWIVGQGTTNLTFFQKIKNTDPLMGAKLKSKTHEI